MEVNLLPDVYFSYSQLFVYDKELVSPACDWTDEHVRQGFARREQAIAIGTLLEFGHARVRISESIPFLFDAYQRVIAVPLEIKSGRLGVEGVEEYPIDRSICVPPGTYRIIVAQRIVDDDREEIDIFLEPYRESVVRSEILIADEALDPPSTLIETAQEPER